MLPAIDPPIVKGPDVKGPDVKGPDVKGPDVKGPDAKKGPDKPPRLFEYLVADGLRRLNQTGALAV